jgi:TPR repeat protein
MRISIITAFLATTVSLAGCAGSTNVYPLFPAEKTTAFTSNFTSGYRYQFGVGVPRNYEYAIYAYEKAADKGDAKALNNLGVMAMRGEGTSVSPGKASSYFKKAALLGSASAHYNLGLLADNGRNPANAAKEYRIAAEMGHPEAQYRLSTMIESGEVISRDPGEARRLLDMAVARQNKEALARIDGIRTAADVTRYLSTENCQECSDTATAGMATRGLDGLAQLADNGDASARYNLAVRRLQGNGANPDVSEAARLFTVAARQGYAPAQRQLAQMYLRGQAVGKSKVLAHMWLNLAARSDGEEGRAALGEMEALEQTMTTSEIDQAQDLAASGANKGR